MSLDKRNTEIGAFLPYGRQVVDEDDIAAVVETLRSDWLTTGPKVTAFEEAVSKFSGAGYGVAVNSGTAALHAAMDAIGVGAGDEVIVPSMTFAATANCVVYQGGVPVFADVDVDTLLLDPADVERKITPKTKAIIAVDYAGHPCDYDMLRAICEKHKLRLVADACHAIGGEYRGRKVGTLADCTVFSFHPVKHITTGEGGMVVTGDATLAEKMRRFRNHGIRTDHRQREEQGTWHYEMADLGYNLRISDFQCALGLSQLRKLSGFLARRRKIARQYEQAFSALGPVEPLAVAGDVKHAWHLYVVRLADGAVRKKVFGQLRKSGIGANVHYIPVHLHPYYRERFDCHEGLCPVAEAAYERILSLPIWPGMDEGHVERVVREISGGV